MTDHSRRRYLSAPAALVVTGALLVAPTPAQAVADDSVEFETVLESDREACSTSDPGSSESLRILENGAAYQKLLLTGYVTSRENPDDVTTGKASVASRIQTTVNDGSLSKLTFSRYGFAETQAVLGLGQTCDAHASAMSEADFDFMVATDSWLMVRQSTRRKGRSEVTISRRGTPGENYFERLAEDLTAETADRVFLPAGEYNFYSLGGFDVVAPTQAGQSSREVGSSLLNLSLHAAGSWTTALVGPGKRYVRIPSSVRCESDSIPVRLKANANTLRFVKLYVNGKLEKILWKPGKNKSVTLESLKPEQATTVKAVVRTKKNRHAKSKLFKVSRSYRACDQAPG